MILKGPILYESIMSDDEQDDINTIWEQIQRRMKYDTQNNVYFDSNNGLSFIQENFVYDSKTIGKLNITYVFYLIRNKQEKADIQNKLNGANLNCEADNNTNSIVIRGIRKMYDKYEYLRELYRDFSHEFHHLYQYKNGFEKTQYANDLYERVKNGISIKDTVINITARLLYYTFNHEISSFAVELYQTLVNSENNEKITIRVLKKMSLHYQNFIQLNNYFDDVLNYDDAENKIFNYFGIDIETIDGRINNTFRVWERYFKKIINKYYLRGTYGKIS